MVDETMEEPTRRIPEQWLARVIRRELSVAMAGRQTRPRSSLAAQHRPLGEEGAEIPFLLVRRRGAR